MNYITRCQIFFIFIILYIHQAELTSHGIEVQYGQYSYDLLNFDWWESMSTLAFGFAFLILIGLSVTSIIVCAKRTVIKLIMSTIFVFVIVIVIFLLLIRDSFVPTHPR